MSIGTQKFRPYFSSAELLEVIAALKERPTAARVALVRALDYYVMKIERGTIAPQHVIIGTATEQLKAAMGLDMPDPDKFAGPSNGDIYAKWKANPRDCTPGELQRVMMYRFENNLMSDDEETIYLSNNGVTY